MTLLFQDCYGKDSTDNYGWFGAQVKSWNRFTPSPAGDVQLNAPATMKITVQPGDVIASASNERSEVLQAFNKNDNDFNGTTGTWWFGMATRLPLDWQDVVPTPAASVPWCIIMQAHGPDSLTGQASSPSLALDLCRFPGRYTLDLRGGNSTNPTIKTLDLGPHVLGTQVDFLLQVGFDPVNGFANAWVRRNTGPGAAWPAVPVSIACPTLYTVNGIIQPGYVKRGCYRTGGMPFTTKLYAGPLAIGTTRPDATRGAFGEG